MAATAALRQLLLRGAAEPEGIRATAATEALGGLTMVLTRRRVAAAAAAVQAVHLAVLAAAAVALACMV